MTNTTKDDSIIDTASGVPREELRGYKSPSPLEMSLKLKKIIIIKNCTFFYL